MKTGTTCTRCANAATCPLYDERMLYGFCQGFVDTGEYIKDVAILEDDEPLVEDFDVNWGTDASGKVFGKIQVKWEREGWKRNTGLKPMTGNGN